MTKKSAVLCLAVLIIPFLIAGCGKSAEEKAIEKFVQQKSGGKVSVDMSQGKVTVKDGNTTVTSGGNVQVPASFPKDVPVYPNTQILNSMTAGDVVHLTLISKESIEKIAASYKEQMKREGWKESASFTMGTTVTMAYDKDTRQATVAISKMDKGESGIQLQVSQKK
jgi:hypothetical protein